MAGLRGFQTELDGILGVEWKAVLLTTDWCKRIYPSSNRFREKSGLAKVPYASFSAGLRVGRLSTYPYETCDFSKTVWIMWLQQAIVIWITFNLTPNIPCYYLWNRRKMGISFSRAFIPRSSLMSAARFSTAPHTLTKVVISRKRLELGLYNFTNLESE